MPFNLLDISRTWDDYWSEHPNGYSPQEQMINWLSQLNAMITEINSFLGTDLQEITHDILDTWLNDGTLGSIIDNVLNQNTARITILENRSFKHLMDYGVVGDGVVDDRAAFQSALTDLMPGDTLIIDKPSAYYRIVNAYATAGLTTVDQRANALANNLVTPLVCTTSNIRIILRGDIKATSILGNLFEVSGNQVQIIGDGGSLYGPGTFHDTNSWDPLQQWHPSLLKVSGDDCSILGVSVIDPPTAGIHCAGDRVVVTGCLIGGGPLAHGAGTKLFAIYLDEHDQALVNRCSTFAHNAGMVYDGVFSTTTNATIRECVFNDVLEHAVYSYAEHAHISKCSSDGTHATAAAFQFSHDHFVLEDCFVENYTTMVQAMYGSHSTIRNNVCKDVTQDIIAYRKSAVVEFPDILKEDIHIEGNTIEYASVPSVGSGITLAGSFDMQNVYIERNVVVGGPGSISPAYAPISVYPGGGYTAKQVYIVDNIIKNSKAWAFMCRALVNCVIRGNTVINANEVSQNRTFELNDCVKNVFSNNVFIDDRAVKKTTSAYNQGYASSTNVFLNDILIGVTTHGGASLSGIVVGTQTI